jgi:hypothetical protein
LGRERIDAVDEVQGGMADDDELFAGHGFLSQVDGRLN